MRNLFIGTVEQNALGLGGGLHPHDPALKIGERVDVAFGIDRDHLAARKVRAGPTIFAFATRHTKAAHDTIELAARQQLFLLFPVNQLVF